MGKHKRERRKPHRENPTGLPSIKSLDEDSEDLVDNDESGALQKVFDQLQLPNVEDKLSGLQTLESMCCDASVAVQIAKEGITRIIGPLLVDISKPVRAASASALWNVAEIGGEEAHENLLKHDVMTPLTALLQKYYTKWQPNHDSKENGKTEDEKETFIQAITLLWTLCEKNEFAIKRSNEEDLISILMKFLDVNVYGIDMSTAVAQCMLTLSEDNPIAIAELKRHEGSLLSLLNLKCDKQMKFSEVTLLRTLAGGLLMNVYSLPCTEAHVRIICKVTSMLSETVTIDHRSLLNTLTSSLPLETINSVHSSRKILQEARQILSAQQHALEILANLCSDDQDSDIDSDLEDTDSLEYIEYMDDDAINDKSYKISSTLPVELTEVVATCNLVQKVWDKTIPVAENVGQILTENHEGKTILKQVHTLRCRAFLCLNNLLSSLDVEEMGGVDNLYRMWIDIGTVVFKNADPNDIELLESATAAMRAALQKLTEVRAAKIFNQLTVADIQPMLNGERQCQNANVRVNLIRIVGNLALILSNSEAAEYHELVKLVSTFLLEVCNTETEAWVIAESLDAIMDIYAEDETNQLAIDVHLVEKLQNLVPLLNNKIRQQKKKLGANALIVSTVKTNLTRFIKYKGSQIAKLK